ncbi:uncharacterized protein A4U43_C08F10720 [Asparagus officinalis]|nr:uncharacterized protein A4U43_C08F10720 [Asparagus officinalis]
MEEEGENETEEEEEEVGDRVDELCWRSQSDGFEDPATTFEGVKNLLLPRDLRRLRLHLVARVFLRESYPPFFSPLIEGCRGLSPTQWTKTQSPSSRRTHGRYADLLGTGAVKRVYRAFDQEEGIEVAWNQVKLSSFANDERMLDRLYSEVKLLKSLRHENIISLYKVWTDTNKRTLNFITEVCTSGNLREYRKKHRHVSVKALKKWSRQILRGLEYLHDHEPCIIHRDLNCSNVFINGNVGQVKIGDLGLAKIVGESHAAHSILGTPEFMAPELYEEEYTEQVDIYSFGMCVLEMATLEIPYSECDSIPKIYKKVLAGTMPAALEKVKNPEVKAFIKRCIAKPRARPSAAQLLKDPFFNGLDDDDAVQFSSVDEKNWKPSDADLTTLKV